MHWIDATCLPETQGAVVGFITNRYGEIDGVLLAGTRPTSLLVCTPPHMAAEIEAAIKLGDPVRIRGVRPREADIIAAVALTVGNGLTIVDNGPGGEDKYEARRSDSKPEGMEAEGVVRLSLYGPKGELRGALLEDGTIIRIDAKEAASVTELLCPGATIAVRGEGLRTKHGRVIAARDIGSDRHKMKSAAKPKEKGKPKHEKRDDRRAQSGVARIADPR
jgi:hypothetical protein